MVACQPAVPKGCCRLTQVRSVGEFMLEERLIDPLEALGRCLDEWSHGVASGRGTNEWEMHRVQIGGVEGAGWGRQNPSAHIPDAVLPTCPAMPFYSKFLSLIRTSGSLTP